MSQEVIVAVEAALQAGKILRERIDDIGKVSFKEFHDPVTEVDHLAEKAIIARIKKTFPDHDILAEESGNAEGSDSTSKWIIDPLDGTLNYSHGYPCYCVSIALEQEGEVKVGVIYNPCLDELFVAEKGQGAILNGNPIHVSTISTLKKSLLVTGFAPRVVKSEKDNLDNFCNFMKACQAVRRPGSAAMDLVYTAMGRFEGFWEFGLQPWDVCAGALILAEAGGKVSEWDGSPMLFSGNRVLATNGHIHGEMMDVLRKDLF